MVGRAHRVAGLTSRPVPEAPLLEREGQARRGGAKKARVLKGGGARLRSAASRPADLEPVRRRCGALRSSAARERVRSERLRRSLPIEGARGWQLRLKHVERRQQLGVMSDSGEQNYGERVRRGGAGGGCVVPACISSQARRPQTRRQERVRLRTLNLESMGGVGLKSLRGE